MLLALTLALVPPQGPSPELLWADLDRDGALDALAVLPNGSVHLWRQDPGAGFGDSTDALGLADARGVSSAALADLDLDGRVDVVLAGDFGVRLLRGTDGPFTDATLGSGLEGLGVVREVQVVDMDGDGRADLYLCGSDVQRVFVGSDSGRFAERTFDPALPAGPLGYAGSTFGAGRPSNPALEPPARDVGRGKTRAPHGWTGVAGGWTGVAGGGTGVAGAGAGGSSVTVAGASPVGPFAPSGPPGGFCAATLRDQSAGGCLPASSLPTLGALYPLGQELSIDAATGFVGLGTTAPLTGLHLESDAGLLAQGAFGVGAIPVEGSGVRMMWYPAKAAFRAGSAGSTAWNDPQVGQFSVGLGSAVTASGSSSFAAGSGGSATGFGSVAIGSSPIASGDSSQAFGTITTAAGTYSMAGGLLSKALGTGTFAFGRDTEARALNCVAIGRYNIGGGSENVWVPSEPLFEVGNGDTPSSRANALTVLKNGRVGVGTASPVHPLEVQGSMASIGPTGGALIAFNPNDQDASVRLDWRNDVARVRIGGSGAGSAGGLDIQRTADISLFRVLHNGNVGIGTTQPVFKLHVDGSAGKPGGGSWSVASDARLKRDVRDLEGALDTLLSLRGVTFEYEDPESIGELPGRRTGFLAQEVERVLPDWVGQNDEGIRHLTVRGFEALAVEALRELDREGGALRAEVAALRAENGALRARFERLEQVVLASDGTPPPPPRVAAMPSAPATRSRLGSAASAP